MPLATANKFNVNINFSALIQPIVYLQFLSHHEIKFSWSICKIKPSFMLTYWIRELAQAKSVKSLFTMKQ